MNSKPISLTGDRPTGRLHLGHYAGSLAKRLEMQDETQMNIMVADMQALTDHGRNPGKVRESVIEVVADQIAVGIDPSKTRIFLQSGVHALDRLSALYANLVTLARVERNPMVRAELAQKGLERDVPVGFLTYPIAQAADITAFKAKLIPVGADQAPMIEQAQEIVHTVNRIAGCDLLVEPVAVYSKTGRLPGIDGTAKASKTLGNAIEIAASAEEVREKVMAMFTDPGHLKVSDPGRVEGNAVFAYLSAFDPDQMEVEALKHHYRRGGLGDMVLKKRLIDVLETLLAPIRERRAEIMRETDDLMDILRQGTISAANAANENLFEIEDALGVLHL